MGQPKFTPGPWRWEVNRKCHQVQLCGGDPKGGFGRYDLTVLSFKRLGLQNAQPVFWAGNKSVGDPKTAIDLSSIVIGREHHESWFRDIDHPDARLIAAAPDLYEALAAVVETPLRQLAMKYEVEGAVETAEQAILVARAALRKAREG